MAYKRPVSILMVTYAQDTERMPMLQRRDGSDFWQSIAGSVEGGETVSRTAMHGVKEEATIDAVAEQPTLIDCQRMVEFEIFSHLRHRYTPGMTRNTESQFCLALPHERQIVLTEHLAYGWLDASAMVAFTRSWGNRQAIEQFVISAA